MSHEGVVTLSLIDWNLPTATDFDAWDFKGLACRSIVHIGPISLNVTMPFRYTGHQRVHIVCSELAKGWESMRTEANKRVHTLNAPL